MAWGDRLLVSFFYHQLFSWGMDHVLAIQGKVNINHPLHLYSPLNLSDAVTSISSLDLIFKSTLGVGGGEPVKTLVDMLMDENLIP